MGKRPNGELDGIRVSGCGDGAGPGDGGRGRAPGLGGKQRGCVPEDGGRTWMEAPVSPGMGRMGRITLEA